MSLETRILAVVQAIGGDIKALRLADGTLAALTTTAKTSLVAAINELQAAVGGAGAQIDDNAANGIAVTYSATKILQLVAQAKSDLVSGAGATLDTLNELAAALGNDANFAATVAAALAARVRTDAAQVLTPTEQAQARSIVSIGATGGTVQLMARSEVSASAITLQAGMAMGYRAI